jgi:hypothetical protein
MSWLDVERPMRPSADWPVGCVYRRRGVVYCDKAPVRAVLQGVGKRVRLSLEAERADCRPRNRVVALGAGGGIDGDGLHVRFDGCVQGMNP